MEYVKFGNTGLRVSKICLGTMTYGEPNERWKWALNEKESRPFIRKALELGINFFDTADIYSYGSSEEILGKALADFGKRDEVVVATKVFNPMSSDPNNRGLSRKHIMKSIDASLRRLGMDHVDIYQIHRWDYNTPVEETMEALHDVVKSGKALYIGASSMYAWQLAKAQFTSALHGWTSFVSLQPHYNLIYREEEREMIPFCIDQKIAVIPWSPMARGHLARTASSGTHETLRAQTDEFVKTLYKPSDSSIIARVSEVAAKRGVSNSQVALAWVLSKPFITSPIIGASKPGHLEDAIASLSLHITAEETRFLEELYQPHNIAGHN